MGAEDAAEEAERKQEVENAKKKLHDFELENEANIKSTKPDISEEEMLDLEGEMGKIEDEIVDSSMGSADVPMDDVEGAVETCEEKVMACYMQNLDKPIRYCSNKIRPMCDKFK